jgi:phage baseplate assembly protein W
MARIQKYGIKYPFENRNTDNIYVDLNENTKDELKSQVLHVLFTPKGQRLRDPNFGTELTKYLFDQKDGVTDDAIIKSVSRDLKAYVPSVNLEKITITQDTTNENSRILIIHYSVTVGNKVEHTTAAVKI